MAITITIVIVTMERKEVEWGIIPLTILVLIAKVTTSSSSL